MTDAKLQQWIGSLLRAGVMIAAVVVAFGGVIHLSGHSMDIVHFGSGQFAGPQLRTLPAVVEGALHFRSDAIVQLGLILLIATPVFRVGLAAVGFLIEGDRLYVVISLIVLAILLFSITHAI